MAELSVRPVRIELCKGTRILEIEFVDGVQFSLSLEFLRVFSPSAEVRGHGAGEGKLEHGKREVGVEQIEPVGNYAVRLKFSDGHATGIYSWQYLRRIGESMEELWTDYLRRLEEAGLSRDR
jgi:DUF971 family protein